MRGVLILAGRSVFGLLSGMVLSMAGVALAWGFFVFSGSQSASIWFVLLLLSAGAGAGIGGFLAWLKIDQYNLGMAAVTAFLAVAAGIGGAWSGYEYGAYRTAVCCDVSGASISLSPVAFSAMGAAVVTSAVMLLFELAKKGFTGRR